MMATLVRVSLHLFLSIVVMAQHVKHLCWCMPQMFPLAQENYRNCMWRNSRRFLTSITQHTHRLSDGPKLKGVRSSGTWLPVCSRGTFIQPFSDCIAAFLMPLWIFACSQRMPVWALRLLVFNCADKLGSVLVHSTLWAVFVGLMQKDRKISVLCYLS
jgi:hypothetical protein